MRYAWILLVILFVAPSSQGQAIAPHLARLKTRISTSQPDTSRVKLLLQLSHEYIFKKGELATDLDTALLLTRQAQSLSYTLRYRLGVGSSYLTAAQAIREKGDEVKGRQYAQRAIMVFSQIGNKPKLIETYLELALSYWIHKEELPKKIVYTQRALTLVQQLGDQAQEANLLKELADLHQILGNYPQAIVELRQALVICQSEQCPDLTGTYDLLGFVSTKLGDYREGLKFGLLAMKRTELNHETGLPACTVYNRVGLTYVAMGQYHRAYAYFKKSYYLAQKNKFNPSIIHLAGNLSQVLLSLNQPQRALAVLKDVARKNPPTQDGSRIHLATRFIDVYSVLKLYSLAQRYADEVLAVTPKEGWESIGQVGIYQSLVRFYIASAQYGKANKYLADNDELCRLTNSPAELAKNHLLWFQLDSIQARFPSAIAHYQKFVALRDSLLNETKSRQIAQLEIQYLMQKKDNFIRLKEQNIRLLTNQSHLQQAQLQRAQMTRNSMIAGSVSLILLLSLGYNRYRLKQRSNQLLEVKQVEINLKNQSLQQVLTEKDHLLTEKEELLEEKGWMLKEIHHRVKNNLQIISSMLSIQSDFLQDPQALLALRDSQNRVYAMALIHQKLYQSDNLALVNMPEFTEEIMDHLMESFAQKEFVRQKLNVTDVQLDVTLATPIGLIINEAVTNSLKYGFPKESHLYRQPGTITVELQPLDEQMYRLTLSDDGVGMPVGLDAEQSSTLGLTMIRGLSRQIGGQLQIHQRPGVHIYLDFSQSKKVSRHVQEIA